MEHVSPEIERKSLTLEHLVGSDGNDNKAGSIPIYIDASGDASGEFSCFSEYSDSYLIDHLHLFYSPFPPTGRSSFGESQPLPCSRKGLAMPLNRSSSLSMVDDDHQSLAKRGIASRQSMFLLKSLERQKSQRESLVFEVASQDKEKTKLEGDEPMGLLSEAQRMLSMSFLVYLYTKLRESALLGYTTTSFDELDCNAFSAMRPPPDIVALLNRDWSKDQQFSQAEIEDICDLELTEEANAVTAGFILRTAIKELEALEEHAHEEIGGIHRRHEEQYFNYLRESIYDSVEISEIDEIAQTAIQSLTQKIQGDKGQRRSSTHFGLMRTESMESLEDEAAITSHRLSKASTQKVFSAQPQPKQSMESADDWQDLPSVPGTASTHESGFFQEPCNSNGQVLKDRRKSFLVAVRENLQTRAKDEKYPIRRSVASNQSASSTRNVVKDGHESLKSTLRGAVYTATTSKNLAQPAEDESDSSNNDDLEPDRKFLSENRESEADIAALVENAVDETFFKKDSPLDAMLNTGVEVVYTGDAHPDDVAFCICQCQRTKTVFVVFRGTVNPSNWKFNIKFSPSEFRNPLHKEPYVGHSENIAVHTGFGLLLLRKRKDTGLRKLDEIFSVVQHFGRKLAPDGSYRVCVTGHSLGGSLATIFCLFAGAQREFTRAGPVNAFTFAPPRAGDQRFKNAFRHLERTNRVRMARFQNEGDLVPLFPHGNWGIFSPFKSVEGGYKHVGLQIRLENFASLKWKLRGRHNYHADITYPDETSGTVAWLKQLYKMSIWANLSTPFEMLRSHDPPVIQRRIAFAQKIRNGYYASKKMPETKKTLDDYYQLKEGSLLCAPDSDEYDEFVKHARGQYRTIYRLSVLLAILSLFLYWFVKYDEDRRNLAKHNLLLYFHEVTNNVHCFNDEEAKNVESGQTVSLDQTQFFWSRHGHDFHAFFKKMVKC